MILFLLLIIFSFEFCLLLLLNSYFLILLKGERNIGLKELFFVNTELEIFLFAILIFLSGEEGALNEKSKLFILSNLIIFVKVFLAISSLF